MSRLVMTAILVAMLSGGSGTKAVLAQTETGGNQGKSALPPIECPLHKAGIDPTKLKPFKEVEKYIQFLERPDRAKWQKPEAVVKALGLKGSETVVDLGAGSGYFSFRFAKALPQGKVVAIDTQPEMIRHIHHRAMSEQIANIEPIIATPGDPKVPPGADVVFICDVLHHVQDRANWLTKLHAEMAKGARLVLIEFKSGDLPQGPPEKMKIPKAEIVRLSKEADFSLKEEQPDLLPYQEFLIFERP